LEYLYQQITYNSITIIDLQHIKGLTEDHVYNCKINEAIAEDQDFTTIDFKDESFKADILQVVEQKRSYLGQMDVNAASPLVWDFYEDTKKNYAVMDNILRLDAFAIYINRLRNFFNKPGTWEYLERIKQIAKRTI
jgi:sucrose phosphorylase